MEARLQTNLDIINQNLSLNSKRAMPIDDNKMDQQFKLPIVDSVTVSPFEKFLKQNTEFKENLIRLSHTTELTDYVNFTFF